MDLNGFNALEIEPATSYEVLPANWYKCVITLMVKISVKPADGQYGASNEVKGYEAALDVVAAVTGAPVAVSSAGAAGAVSVPPWKR